MAENNTVPLGRAGTGPAFVLGENEALNRYLQNEDYNTQVDRQKALLAQKAKQDQQKQLHEDYLKNALNVKAGLIFQDVDEQAKQVVEKGKALYQKGVNPWMPYTGNDPAVKAEVEDLQRNKMMVEQQAQRREALQPKLLNEMTSYDPSKHTKRSFDELNEYTKLPASEAFKRPVPTLQPKLQPNQVLDKVKLGKVGEEMVIGNKRIKKEGLQPSVARAAIVDALKLENGVEDFLTEDLGITGYTIDALEKLPKTLDGIKESAIKEYKGNPRFREELAKQGITSAEQFEQVASEKAIEAFQSKQKWEGFIESATKNKLAELGSSISIVNDFTEEDQAIQRRNEKRAEERLAMDRQKAAEGKDETPETVRQSLVSGLLQRDPSARNILQAQVKANPEYGGKTVVFKFNKNGTTTYEIPPKLDNDGEVKQKAYSVTIEEGKKSSAYAINQIISDVTGENVPYGGYKGVKGNKNKNPETEKKAQPSTKVENLRKKYNY